MRGSHANIDSTPVCCCRRKRAATGAPRANRRHSLAVGVAAHGIGTSRAFSVHPEAGGYASLAMGLHGILGAVVIPLIAGYFTIH